MNNTVVLLVVVSRSRTVVTLNREFLFLMPRTQIETLVVERKKIITPLYMDAGA